METEKCEGCGVEVEKGTLIRDSVDASQLRCVKCIGPDKKARKPRKRKEKPVIAPAALVIDPQMEKYKQQPELSQEGVLALRLEAEKWANECGLIKVTVQGPNREDFPRYGFGYAFQIMETAGKQRRATARFTSTGLRNMWTLDGAAI